MDIVYDWSQNVSSRPQRAIRSRQNRLAIFSATARSFSIGIISFCVFAVISMTANMGALLVTVQVVPGVMARVSTWGLELSAQLALAFR